MRNRIPKNQTSDEAQKKSLERGKNKHWRWIGGDTNTYMCFANYEKLYLVRKSCSFWMFERVWNQILRVCVCVIGSVECVNSKQTYSSNLTSSPSSSSSSSIMHMKASRATWARAGNPGLQSDSRSASRSFNTNSLWLQTERLITVYIVCMW